MSQVCQVVLVVKSMPANAGDFRDAGSIPGSGRSPGGGHGNPFQYSCLENPMDRGTWWATVHEVAGSQTLLRHFHFRYPFDEKKQSQKHCNRISKNSHIQQKTEIWFTYIGFC